MTTIRVASYSLDDRGIVETVGTVIEVLDYSRAKGSIKVVEAICGEEMESGERCTRDPGECHYHS